MMPKITSAADWFHRAKTDERYRQLMINVYRSACYPRPLELECTFENAKRWTERWIADNVKPDIEGSPNRTCYHLVAYANQRRGLIDQDCDGVLAATEPAY